jgi:hypothetical protein
MALSTTARPLPILDEMLGEGSDYAVAIKRHAAPSPDVIDF